ncbi:hypothetical protein F5B22DRAFT_658340 [Xylaria bambusicola]|uniref:uncharacterized protein n=1 Tax=Xylaria bambusicola TaxID=326684 RepID=UPI002007801C|nr:uncharacterized protein F5B22DRAFT_658340 [Xylaria bambusicola]KAI0525506.1 hypothetical protein F5B22DRAFT_658340 [Xylaria bambusicola]
MGVLMLFHLLIATLAKSSAAAVVSAGDVAATYSEFDYSSLSCPSSILSTLTTPTYGDKGAIFTVCSSIDIEAPVTVIRDVVLDFKSYHLWNSFVVSVSVPPNVAETPQDLYVGMPMVFTTAGLIKGLNTSSDEILTIVDSVGVGTQGNSYSLVAWRYDDKLAGLGSRAEHPYVIIDQGCNSSKVLSYETYYFGLLTPAIALLGSSLQEQFSTQAANLKAYVEGL